MPAPETQRSIVVQKYGGSSVADVEKIGRVADKVVETRRAGADVVVVVSAMGKTTDGLIRLANDVVSGHPVADVPRRELDMLVSTGERVSMSLLSIAIQARGVEAISFTGSQSGILTNDRHFDARIIEVRPHRIEDELARGRVVIVAGYQGMSYKREITTLGRGGSDTTAVALAAALRAERCEIYSDVDGVYSADPRAVEGALHLPELDHALLQEMAEGGAKVICAQAVEWARRSGITLHARSTYDAGRETVIRPARPGSASVRAVCAEQKLLMIRWSGVPLQAVLAGLGEAGLPYKDLTSSAGGGTALVPVLNVPDPEAAARALRARVPEVAVDEGLASVSVVGDGLADSPEALTRFCRATERAGAAPRALTAGPLRLTAVVAAGEALGVQRAVHEELVGGAPG